MQHKLILASSSEIRNTLLRRAGVAFTAIKPRVDEELLKSSRRQQDNNTLALDLAGAKALSLTQDGAMTPGAMTLGADQTLLLGNVVFSKPKSISEAKQQLQILSGHTHTLQSALAISQAGRIIWSHVSEARLTMRTLSQSYIDDYLASEDADVLTSVGCYKLESRGIQLFENIEGDYFTILGLPLMPLLHFLRETGIVAA